jgi:thiamine-phosphate pyrophosphorylase
LGRPSTTSLYLVIDAGPAPAAVESLLAATGAQALLIAPGADRPLDAGAARPLVDLAQARGIAALIEGDAQLARTLRADGVHVPWCKDVIARYAQARGIVGGRSIVGADAGRSRHEAMELGEAGADYVGFGIPAHVEDRETARARRYELVRWWSELVEVPCVGFDVEAPEEVSRLVTAGADFVAVRAPRTLPSDELQHWAEDMAKALSPAEDVA